MQQQTLSTKGASTMKHKKAVAAFAIALFVAAFASAQRIYKHFYSNRQYSGDAGATYLGTTRSVDPSRYASDTRQRYRQTLKYIGSCSGLSNRERFLLWSVLGEYNYSDNEVYLVEINIQDFPVMVLDIVVVITNNGQSCTWYDVGYWK